jgi:hypothetical protein
LRAGSWKTAFFFAKRFYGVPGTSTPVPGLEREVIQGEKQAEKMQGKFNNRESNTT